MWVARLRLRLSAHWGGCACRPSLAVFLFRPPPIPKTLSCFCAPSSHVCSSCSREGGGRRPQLSMFASCLRSLRDATPFPSPRSGFPCWKLLRISTLPSFVSREEQEVILEAVCVHLQRRKWGFLQQVAPALSEHMVQRVILLHRASPMLSLEFFNWAQRQQLERKDLSLSLESYAVMIHVLVAGRRFEEALSLMKHLMQDMGVPALEIVDSLVSSRGCCGRNTDAFDTLVRACTQIGSSGDAYKVIDRLRVQGFWVSIHAWNNLLSYLSKSDDNCCEFWRVYKEMLSCGYIENVNTFNSIVYALCKECRLWEAFTVLYSTLKRGVLPNVVTVNMLIDGCCRNGEIGTAVKLVKKIHAVLGNVVQLNFVSYNCLINGLCKSGNAATAENIIRGEMTKLGFKPNLRSYAALVDGYAREEKIEVSFRLCDQMVREGLLPNTVIYNSIIYWLFKWGYAEEASFLFSDMEGMHMSPDHFSYTILVDGYCKNHLVQDAIGCHRKIREANLMSDVFTYNILINHLFKIGDIRGAKQLLGDMFTCGMLPDMVTYSTLINGYCQERRLEDALQVYDEMVIKGHRPNLITYNSFINGLCKNERFDNAASVIDEMKKHGLFPDIITYNTLLNGYCRSHMSNDAFALCSEMKRLGIMVNEVTYNVLINYLCKAMCLQQAKEFMKLKFDRGLIPHHVTYTTLITEFSKSCTASEVIALHDYMVIRGVLPDEYTYNAIVRLLIQREYSYVNI